MKEILVSCSSTLILTWYWGLLHIAATFSSSVCFSQSLCRQPGGLLPLLCYPPGQGSHPLPEAAGQFCQGERIITIQHLIHYGIMASPCTSNLPIWLSCGVSKHCRCRVGGQSENTELLWDITCTLQSTLLKKTELQQLLANINTKAVLRLKHSRESERRKKTEVFVKRARITFTGATRKIT